MTSSKPNADSVPQTQPEPTEDIAAPTAAEKPEHPRGFWQQPTEPMEKAFRARPAVSSDDA